MKQLDRDGSVPPPAAAPDPDGSDHNSLVRAAGLLGGARTRILAAYVILLAISALVAVVAIDRLLSARTGDRVQASLQQEVEEFDRLLERGEDPRTGKPFSALPVEAVFDTFLARNVPSEGETLLTLIDGERHRTVSGVRGGRTRLRRYEPMFRSVRDTSGGELDTPNGVVRYLVEPVVRDGQTRGHFVIASALWEEQEEVDDAIRIIAFVMIGVILLASVFSWFVAGRVLAPLRLLSETARGITETDLTRRIPSGGQDELSELARTFNAMLDRLEVAFASQRAFVRDASHELRTPITIVRGHLELMGDEPDDRRETVAVVTDELDRMNRFVDDLLLLAQAERRDFLQWEDVELAELTDELMTKARGLAPREWRLDARGSGTVRADRQRLTQALMGLAQNASQHTEPGDVVALGSAVRGDEVRLWVRDDGPGVAEADQSRIFERFARGSGSRRRSEGAGLGLAIVEAIAEAHGGRVELWSRPGEGARFTVVIPR